MTLAGVVNGVTTVALNPHCTVFDLRDAPDLRHPDLEVLEDMSHGQGLMVLTDSDWLAVELAEADFGQHADPRPAPPMAGPLDLP